MTPVPSVTVSVFGKFHAFRLAAQLARRGALHRLITTYPRSAAVSDGVPPEAVRSLAWIGAGHRAACAFASSPWVHRFWHAVYEHRSPRWIGKPTVCVGWSGSALPVLLAAKAERALTVVERGSHHILAQREILETEHARMGIAAPRFSEATIARELAEYDAADRIAIPSRAVERSFVARGVPASKLIRVPYGVDLSAFGGPARPPDRFRVLFVGAISIRKGVHCLLEACQRLRRLPGFELVLAGAVHREMRASMRRFEGGFTYLGKVSHRQLAEVYPQASVFCLPSLEEGLALVLGEALAAGLPVVATLASGAEEFITDGVEGLLLASSTPEAITEAIEKLYREPDRLREMADAARTRARLALDWSHYGDRILAEYSRALTALQGAR